MDIRRMLSSVFIINIFLFIVMCVSNRNPILLKEINLYKYNYEDLNRLSMHYGIQSDLMKAERSRDRKKLLLYSKAEIVVVSRAGIVAREQINICDKLLNDTGGVVATFRNNSTIFDSGKIPGWAIFTPDKHYAIINANMISDNEGSMMTRIYKTSDIAVPIGSVDFIVDKAFCSDSLLYLFSYRQNQHSQIFYRELVICDTGLKISKVGALPTYKGILTLMDFDVKNKIAAVVALLDPPRTHDSDVYINTLGEGKLIKVDKYGKGTVGYLFLEENLFNPNLPLYNKIPFKQ